MSFVNAHFVAYATDAGIAPGTAALMLGSVGGSSVAGALAFGHLADRVGQRPMLVVGYTLRGGAYAVLLAASTLPLMLLGVLLIGVSWTMVISLTGSYSAERFGIRRLATIYGAMFSVMPIGSALGVWLAGRAFDVYGSYDAALTASMLVGLAAAAIVAFPQLPRRDRQSVSQPGGD
jgi:MFS family permease